MKMNGIYILISARSMLIGKIFFVFVAFLLSSAILSAANARSRANSTAPRDFLEKRCEDHGGALQASMDCKCMATNEVIEPGPNNHCGISLKRYVKRNFRSGPLSGNMCKLSTTCSKQNPALKKFYLSMADFVTKNIEAHYASSERIKDRFKARYGRLEIKNCWQLAKNHSHRNECLELVKGAVDRKIYRPSIRYQLDMLFRDAQTTMINYLKALKENYGRESGQDSSLMLTAEEEKFINKFIQRISLLKRGSFPRGRYHNLEFKMSMSNNLVYTEGYPTLLNYGLTETVFKSMLHEIAHLADYGIRSLSRGTLNPFMKMTDEAAQGIEHYGYSSGLAKRREMSADIIATNAYFYEFSKPMSKRVRKGVKLSEITISNAVATACGDVIERGEHRLYLKGEATLDYIISANPTYREEMRCSQSSPIMLARPVADSMVYTSHLKKYGTYGQYKSKQVKRNGGRR